MRLLRTLASALGASAAIALLVACSGGPQLAPASPLPGAGARPDGGWFSPQADFDPLLFVADQPNQRVVIFPENGGPNPAPVGQITDAIAGPDGLFVDKKGTLYVCNFGNGTVTEYPRGQTTHSKTLTGAGSAKYVIAGTDGTVYVSNFDSSSNGTLLEYAGGSTTPTTTILIQKFPAGLALDTSNNLFVVFNSAASNDVEVLKFAPGSMHGTNLGIHLTGAYAGGATFDKAGNLLLVDQSLPGVDVFPPGATKPSKQIKGFSLAYQIAMNRATTHLFVTNPVAPSVVEVTYPAGKVINTISNSLKGAYGVATAPDDPY
jgi:hypothetical protein